MTATESLGGEGYNISSTQTAGQDQAKQSEQVKKDFRESVLKSAQEYKQQHRTEIDTSESDGARGDHVPRDLRTRTTSWP